MHIPVACLAAVGLTAACREGLCMPQRTLRLIDRRPCLAEGGRRFTAIYSETHPHRMHEHNPPRANLSWNKLSRLTVGPRSASG